MGRSWREADKILSDFEPRHQLFESIMSENEAANEEDISLPKATVHKFVTGWWSDDAESTKG